MRAFVLAVPLCLFLLSACSDSGVDPQSQYEFLTVSKVTFSSIALRVENHADGTPCHYMIFRNGVVKFEGKLIAPDTVLTDTDVRWGNDYTYKGYRYNDDGIVSDTTLPFTVRVSDRSESAFDITRNVYGIKESEFFDMTSGEGGGIYLAGIIETKESSLNTVTISERVMMDAFRFLYKTDSTDRQVFEPVTAIGSIGDRTAWIVGQGGAVISWRGLNGTIYPGSVNLGSGITKIWGNRSDNVYFAGKNGLLWHFDGTGFIPLHTEFTNDITDMTGIDYPIIIAPGSPKTVYKANGNRVEPLYRDITFPPGIRSMCGNIFVGDGGGDIRNGSTLTHIPSMGEWSGTIVRGAERDMIAIGSGGKLMHFDGEWWAPVQTPFPLEGMRFNALIYNAPQERVFHVAGADEFGRALYLKGTAKK